MKHRLLLLLLCAFALFSLSACGTTDTPDSSDSSQQGVGTIGSIQDFDQTEPAQQEQETPAILEQPDGSDAGNEPTEAPGGSSQSPAQSQQTAAPTPAATPSTETPSTAITPPASETTPSPEPEESGPRILIAYFTWADNTVVDDPSSVDVDATTSASVLAPGHVSQMAGWIQEETGGDLFSIKVADPYSSDYDECLDRAADEKADNARPALSGSVSNMEDHDVVFLGYPDWWSTCPMAIFSFLDSYDFSGKTIIPFCAHGTSGLGSSVRDIKAALPGVTVLDAVGVQRPGMDTPLNSAESTVKNWLARLDY